MEDKSGKALNKPVDAWNHIIDASRYVCMEVLGQSFGYQFVSNY